MTDITKLAKRLRVLSQWQTGMGTSEPEDHIAWVAADALEAQARRIAELEAENKTLREALKPFAAVKERDIELWYGLDPDPFVPDDAALNSIDNSPTVGDLRAARAKLNGEKG